MELTEDNLDCNVPVIYQGKEYLTGNRGHGMVELFDGDEFYEVVRFSDIRIKDPDYLKKKLIDDRNYHFQKIQDINNQLSKL